MKNRLYMVMLMLCMGITSVCAQVIVSGTVADDIEPLMMVNVVEVEYGAEIPEYVYEELGDPIKDWKIKDEEQDYITMPAKNIAYTGSISSTGIDHSAIDSQSVIYDLSGRRVLKAVKGFYIINGKKVFVK